MDETSKEAVSLKYWERLGYAIFTAAIVGAAWAVGRAAELGAGDWSGWVQAIGSIAAIIGAYFFGERQAQIALSNALKLQQVDVQRKNGSIFAVVSAAHREALRIAAVYAEGDPHHLIFHLTYEAKVVEDFMDALAAIPAHELGSSEAVSAFLQMRKSFIYLHRHLEKDSEFLDTNHAMDDNDVERKRRDIADLVRTNCRLIDRYYRELEKAFT